MSFGPAARAGRACSPAPRGGKFTGLCSGLTPRTPS
jgi:hypothetical protein